jgi:uncharacterized protein (TIGR00251 family)
MVPAPDTTTLRVTVKPNARESRLEELEDGSWRALLKAPPVDGKANTELISLIAKHFKVSKSSVEITGGASARHKRVRITG